MSESVRLEIKRIRENAVMPFYAREGDAGMDLSAAEDVILAPGETKTVPTGLILSIPRGYEVQIRPRSGLSLRTRLRLPNAPGTIDSGYKDELQVIVHNASACAETDEVLGCQEKENRAGYYKIVRGDRIAQMVLAKVSEAQVCEVANFTESDMPNRGGGFGSSGIGKLGSK